MKQNLQFKAGQEKTERQILCVCLDLSLPHQVQFASVLYTNKSSSKVGLLYSTGRFCFFLSSDS